MVKKIIASVLCSSSFLLVSAQYSFVIKGNTKDTSRENQNVVISYFNGEKNIRENTRIKDGAFEFKGTISEPTKVTLLTAMPKKEKEKNPWVFNDIKELYIDSGTTIIQASYLLKDGTVTSKSIAQKDFDRLHKLLLPFQTKDKNGFDGLLAAKKAGDSIAFKRNEQQSATAKKEIDSTEFSFIKKNPSSFVALDLLKEKATSNALAKEKEKIAVLFEGLSSKIRQSISGTKLSEQIKFAYKLAAGKPSIDFTLNDTLGNPVTLSSYRGKYVLLDFWASWCIPCRFENPNVVKAYNKYHDKNFTVLGVSLEQAGHKQEWLDAIHKDNLTWTHVADLSGPENEVTKAYGITSIPMNFLIDPNGTIVAVHLRGEELDKKLSELLDK